MNAKRQRLDQAVVARGLAATRSQAENWIRLGKVTVSGRTVTKPGFFAGADAQIGLEAKQQYVSRAALKLASVAEQFKLDFRNKVVLDVGSSTGGFTDYALQHGARKIIAVEAGKEQLHPNLRSNPKIELHEQTDIRTVLPMGAINTGFSGQERHQDALNVPRSGGSPQPTARPVVFLPPPDIVLVDVSFISLRDILPHVAALCTPKTQIVAMLKPQFEAAAANLKHKGVIKNDRMRRDIIKNFETWVRGLFVVFDKSDSQIAGTKGNVERFYLLGKAVAK